MSVYKVERRVDTVIIEMDISVAEQLVEILGLVRDVTYAGNHRGSDIENLLSRMVNDADVRTPSALSVAETRGDKVILRDTTGDELMERREEYRSKQ